VAKLAPPTVQLRNRLRPRGFDTDTLVLGDTRSNGGGADQGGIERALSVGYIDCLDAAPPHSAALTPPISSDTGAQGLGLDGIQEPELYLKELSGLSIDEFRKEADADSVGLRKDELARVLLALGVKYNYGLAPGTAATRAQIGAFWRTLQLQDLALAHACALGREVAWQQFMARFRELLMQAAIGITGSVAQGQELADSVYAQLYGLTERGEQRRSPLAYYSGRGSLKGFLRATLAQRNVDHHRSVHRETPLTKEDLAAPPPDPIPASDMLLRLVQSLTATLGSLAPEERFLLSAWFLDQHTMLEISGILRVHEATVSRRLQRLTTRLHKELLKNMRASGMSRIAAEEALGTDPRDVDINLRSLLQASQPATFLQQGAPHLEKS
jgi:RNA polymerase sigma-70 factor (ECF subfamily)